MMRGLPSDFRHVTHVHAQVAYRTDDGRQSTFWLDTGPSPGRADAGGHVPVRYEGGEHGPRVVSEPGRSLTAALFFLAGGLIALVLGLLIVVSGHP